MRPGLEAAHHVPESYALLLADEIVGRDRVIVEVQLNRVQSPVSQLVQVPANLETRAGLAAFHHEGAQSPVPRLHASRSVRASRQNISP